MALFKKGFTLFEVLLYVAILSTITYFVGGFAFNLYMGKERVENVQEMNANGRLMLDTMVQAIEKSLTITDVAE